MADLCIVCEAFLQSFQEYLLCDRCRKPAETSVDEESPMSEGVEETSLHPKYVDRFQKTFQSEEGRITRVKRKLLFWGSCISRLFYQPWYEVSCKNVKNLQGPRAAIRSAVQDFYVDQESSVYQPTAPLGATQFEKVNDQHALLTSYETEIRQKRKLQT